MSAYHQIFLDRSAEGRVVVEALARITGSAPQRGDASDGSGVQMFIFGRSVVELEMSHNYEDDLGIAFSDFPTMITVRNLDSDKSKEMQTAKRLFDELMKYGSFGGILVFDLQKILARC
ncbi:hypothetical protein [Nocardia sp. NPDC003345]